MKRALAALLLAPLACTAAPLDTFQLRVGGYASRVNTELALVKTDIYDSTLIDFDEELALEERSVVEFVGIAWRPWRRHQFDLNYHDQRMSGTRRLERDVEFEGDVYVVDSTVQSSLSLRAVEFSYTGWVLLDETWALGLRVGYLDYKMNAGVELLLAPEGEPPAVSAVTRFDDHVPVPSIGLDMRAAIGADWRMKLRVGWLERKLPSVSPRMLALHVGVEYFPWENLGAWVDIGINRLDVDSRRETYNGALRFDEGGVRLGGSWRF